MGNQSPVLQDYRCDLLSTTFQDYARGKFAQNAALVFKTISKSLRTILPQHSRCRWWHVQKKVQRLGKTWWPGVYISKLLSCCFFCVFFFTPVHSGQHIFLDECQLGLEISRFPLRHKITNPALRANNPVCWQVACVISPIEFTTHAVLLAFRLVAGIRPKYAWTRRCNTKQHRKWQCWTGAIMWLCGASERKQWN